MPQKWIAALTALVASCTGIARPLSARLAQMRAMQAVTLEITRELDLSTLLELIVRHAVELTGSSSGGIHLWDEATQLLPSASYRLENKVKEVYLQLGEGLRTVAQCHKG
jgi:hypothetical protein